MTKPIHKRKSPELPISIKIGHRDISVIRATLDELGDADGDYTQSRQRIRIGDWLTPQNAAETLLHEVLHACWPNRWSRLGDVEEDIVDPLASTLAGVWRDNPDLVEWITHNLLGE